ncbi:hypothetical protein [Bryobacter aggregatus]|uniref:hypothetical protein n=1 Tax=Bryobacter aggregatus TaxID=360054 RepID=UPI0004E20BEC|nr:hypothetical protein [Bryobacter aggregatus]
MKWLLLITFVATVNGQDLGAAIAAAPPETWVGYEVPMQSGRGTICSNWNGNNSSIHTYQSKLMLDGPRTMKILFNGSKMLLASEDCVIDTGSQKLIMLPNISPAASIHYLAKREDDSGIHAISLHKDPLAVPTLIAMIRDSKNAKRQKKAMFWLARSTDPKAEEFILSVLR